MLTTPPRKPMTARQAALLHLVLTHIACSPELCESVANSTKIPNFELVLRELRGAVAEQMHGPIY